MSTTNGSKLSQQLEALFLFFILLLSQSTCYVMSLIGKGVFNIIYKSCCDKRILEIKHFLIKIELNPLCCTFCQFYVPYENFFCKKCATTFWKIRSIIIFSWQQTIEKYILVYATDHVILIEQHGRFKTGFYISL